MAEQDTNFTPFHKKVLTQYQSFHASPPSLGSLIALSARGHILMAVVVIAASILCFNIGITPIGYVMIGMLVGAVSRDMGHFRKLSKGWPLLDRIIDWATVNTLLSDGPTKPNA
jgi:hypothetical protein